MVRSSIEPVEALKEQLFLVPNIVNQIKRKDSHAILDFEEWLKSTEELLKKYGYAQCAELAGLRGKLFTPGFSDSQRRARRKEELRIASEIVYDAQHVVSAVLSPLEGKVNEARSLITQILAVVRPTGMLAFDRSCDFNQFTHSVWHRLKTNEHVGGGVTKVLTLVSEFDALRIIAEEIEII